jgi:hypothetical protein
MPSTISGNVAGHLEQWFQVRADEVVFANYLFDTAERLLRLIQGDDPNKRIMMTICMASFAGLWMERGAVGRIPFFGRPCREVLAPIHRID